MLGDKIKIIRKEKGISQEELASKIHVVRQTVSKWEKNQSVPDADMLEKIADVFEVSVSELLGAEMVQETNRNEIAEQLSKINEQLILQNRRSARIWKTVVIALMVVFAGGAVVIASGVGIFASDPSHNEIVYQTEITGTVLNVQKEYIIVSTDGKAEEYKIRYDDMNSDSILDPSPEAFSAGDKVHVMYGGLPENKNYLSNIDQIEFVR